MLVLVFFLYVVQSNDNHSQVLSHTATLCAYYKFNLTHKVARFLKCDMFELKITKP
jgi:hypothetical protein